MGCSFGYVEALGAGCTVVGVWQGWVDVGLVLGLPCGGFSWFCWGSGAHWGLHFLGSLPQCGALWILVDGGGVGESGVSLGSLNLPVGVSSWGSSVQGFVSLGLFVIFHCWCMGSLDINREDFSTVFC